LVLLPDRGPEAILRSGPQHRTVAPGATIKPASIDAATYGNRIDADELALSGIRSLALSAVSHRGAAVIASQDRFNWLKFPQEVLAKSMP
jgi:hypothetical protein